MKILVTGKKGQVARSIAERALKDPSFSLIFAARPQVDLTKPGSLASAIENTEPDIILNAAAFTHVDQAEYDAAIAYRVNAEAAGEGAEAAARLRIPFLQLSTDYVFDGSGDNPWRETDPVAPLNIYGRSKADGEARVLAASPRHLVVRTSWLVSPFGQNFVKTMLGLAAEREEISVVDDQHGCPTSTLDLVDSLLALAARTIEEETAGIWHLAGQGAASWATLAQCIMEASLANGGPFATIRAVTSADFPTPAKRPRNSVLDCGKARDKLGIELPNWRGSIGAIVERLVVRT